MRITATILSASLLLGLNAVSFAEPTGAATTTTTSEAATTANTITTPAPVATTTQATDDNAAVAQANTQFYVALNALFIGDASVMNQVWSHASDVTYLGPIGGFQVGWPQVNAHWNEQAALKLGGRVIPQDAHVTIGGDIAIVQCYETGDNLSADGEKERVNIRATNVFRKENGAWKMISHHTDLLNFLINQEDGNTQDANATDEDSDEDSDDDSNG